MTTNAVEYVEELGLLQQCIVTSQIAAAGAPADKAVFLARNAETLSRVLRKITLHPTLEDIKRRAAKVVEATNCSCVGGPNGRTCDWCLLVDSLELYDAQSKTE